jgi:DNA-binding MarR family transcriptional regulator
MGYNSAMQSLQSASNPPTESYACAQEVLEAIPLVMRLIRNYMRQHRSGLTVPQFRTLCYLSNTPQSSLSDVADFIGLSLPAMSRMVDGLVDKGLLDRRTCQNDRRHVRLSVTPLGETTVAESRQLAQEQLAEVVRRLTPQQQSEVASTMRLVRDIFTPELAAEVLVDVAADNA